MPPAHIPGAVFFDIDKIADAASPLPHMLASPAEFARIAGAMGISDTDIIVVYDGMGLFSAARAWWNFRIMGAESVFILDGGFPAWKAAGYATSAETPHPAPKSFKAIFQCRRRALEGRSIENIGVQIRPIGGFAARRPLFRRCARAAPRPALRPHSRREVHAVFQLR